MWWGVCGMCGCVGCVWRCVWGCVLSVTKYLYLGDNIFGITVGMNNRYESEC